MLLLACIMCYFLISTSMLMTDFCVLSNWHCDPESAVLYPGWGVLRGEIFCCVCGRRGGVSGWDRVQKAVPGGFWPLKLTAKEKPSDALLSPCAPWNMATTAHLTLALICQKCLTSQFPTGYPLPSGQPHTYSSISLYQSLAHIRKITISWYTNIWLLAHFNNELGINFYIFTCNWSL